MSGVMLAERPVTPSPPGSWHALDAREVARHLQTGESGLATAEVAARRQQFGPNQLKEKPPTNPLVLLLRQLRSPLLYLLMAAAAVSLALGEVVDAGVIGAVLVLDAAIGFAQERQAEQAVRALARLAAPRARVIRDGREAEIESIELVPGDLVLVESGTRVPADIRLVATTALAVDESLLTGESVPVAKAATPLPVELTLADRRNMALAGTTVTSGRGRGFVVATGGQTELGSIAAEIETERAETPLQHRLSQLARVITAVVVIAAAAVMGLGVALGHGVSEMLTVSVATAVSAVPEGLPIAYTITLAIGVRRMARRNAVIRRLPAVETLGSTSVIGSDKTGTLTKNRMTVQEIWAGGRTVTIPHPGHGDPEALVRGSPLHLTLLAGILTNEAAIQPSEDGYQTTGDPTEAALLVAAARLGLDPAEADAYPLVAELPFEPERQFSFAIRRDHGQDLVFVKGAPERVLGMCSQLLTPDGPIPLDHNRIHDAAQRFAVRGLRVLAMAYGPAAEAEPDEQHDPHRLVFLGLQGMLDPPRGEVRDAIAGCQRAGIRVVMITGDHAETARAIAQNLGISGPDAAVLTGSDLERMDDAALEQRVGEVAIYARVTPEHKLRVVRALQHHGQVVAVTGDGVNDAPALHAADIGIAMGKGGTDVARAASDMVLTDDNFVSISAAVEEGRIVFDNLRKVTFFLVSTGVAEIITILVALALGWPIPYLAAQIIWLNLVTNGFQDVALAFEPGDPDVLAQPPRPRGEPIISRLLWERTIVSGLVMATGTLLLFDLSLRDSGSLRQAQTVALTTMVLFQAFHVGNARAESRSAFRLSPLSNPFLFVATAGAFIVHVAALYLPPTQAVLRVEPIDLRMWPIMVAVASSIVFAIEAHKLLRRRPGGSPSTAAPRTAL